MAFLAYGQMSVGLSDKQVIEKAVLLLRHYDTTVLDINRLMTAKWHQNGGYAVIYSLEDDESKPIDVYIVLSFTDPPPYESYTQGGPDSRIVERFMAQINKKLSNNIPLINFIRKDLIVTLEYADGSKIIFDAYYTDIRKSLPFWRKEFDPKTGPMFRYYSD
jgi:hypothetical protein